MNLVDISAINLIPELVKNLHNLTLEIRKLKEQLNPKYDLTKRADILKYFNISESTLLDG